MEKSTSDTAKETEYSQKDCILGNDQRSSVLVSDEPLLQECDNYNGEAKKDQDLQKQPKRSKAASNEIRKERMKIQNKKAATKYRVRQKTALRNIDQEYVEELEENRRLKLQLSELRKEWTDFAILTNLPAITDHFDKSINTKK